MAANAIKETKVCCDCGKHFQEESSTGNPYRRCHFCRKKANRENIELSQTINWGKIEK